MENHSSKGLGAAKGSGLAAFLVWASVSLVPFVAFVPFVSSVASAQVSDRARTEALARRAAERLQSLQREADRLAAQERTLIGDLRKLELERQVKGEELKQFDRDAAKLEAELAGITERMDALQQSERKARPELTGRLVEMYKLGQARYLRLLLSAPDLRRMGQASRTVAALAKLDRDRVAARARTLAELTSTRVTLEQRAGQLAAARAAAAAAESAVARAAQSRNELIRDIDRRRDLNAQLSGELQAAQQKLQVTLREVAAGSSPAEPAALPLRPFRGELDWPVAGTVVAPLRPLGRTIGGVEQRHRDWHGRGRDGCRDSRRNGGVCGRFWRIRESGDPRPWIADLQLVWRPPRHRGQERSPAGTRARHRFGRRDRRRHDRPVLRATRRRSARGPVTMVEETLALEVP